MHYVVIGAGPTGVIAAETLRKSDPSGTVTLVGDEPEPPYSRMAIPYLLTEKIGESGTHLRHDADYFDGKGIAVRRERVTSLDAGAQSLSLDSGEHLSYDKLLIASGSSPIRPPVPGMDLPGVATCWTLADARQIAERAKPGASVVLIGAGFIGCIILEALALRGVKLTVIEMGDRMVPRMMNETAGGMIKRWCEGKGIAVHTSRSVTEVRDAGASPAPAPQPASAPSAAAGGGISAFFKKLLGLGESAPAPVAAPAPAPAAAAAGGESLVVVLDDGTELAADLVISAAGVRPNAGFLEGTGVEIDTGIKVDRHMRTNLEGVYAAGDVAEGRDFSTGEYQVHAIQPTAAEHARVAAQNMAGHATEYAGSLSMNVLDTLGLISSSFGQWMGVAGGQSAELLDAEGYRYINLQFDGEVLVGATTLGWTQHVGVLRGLIQGKTPLGKWKQRLMDDPTKIMEAYLECNHSYQ